MASTSADESARIGAWKHNLVARLGGHNPHRVGIAKGVASTESANFKLKQRRHQARRPLPLDVAVASSQLEHLGAVDAFGRQVEQLDPVCLRALTILVKGSALEEPEFLLAPLRHLLAGFVFG